MLTILVQQQIVQSRYTRSVLTPLDTIMAAAGIQLRSALQGLGFSQDAATYIMNTQGYDTPEDFALLSG